ncbi:MAG: PQQ-dependent sugar dehydrogenase, partial [Thermoanaerobaculia bacterium]
LGSASGFLTSLAIDSHGTVYYTVQDGTIFRFVDGESTQIAQVATIGFGDSGLLGMALIDDRTAVVHYTSPGERRDLVTHDVVSRIDLVTGAETRLHEFACDVDYPSRGVSTEHHGGNPVVAPDGSVFVGIGEYNGFVPAQLPNWNGGRVWRVYPDGAAVEYVKGLRNPFDFAWDDLRQRLIIPDNGPIGREDELDIVTKGANCGWPWWFGRELHGPESVAPAYVWDEAIVPTGTLALAGSNDQLRAGVLVTGFYSHAVHYFADLDVRPLPDPITVVDTLHDALIDVVEAPDGTIYVASSRDIYRVTTPRRGDCDGNLLVNASDLAALREELQDGVGPRIGAQNGSHRGSWGCDANGDDVIDSADMNALAAMVTGRRRATRSGR